MVRGSLMEGHFALVLASSAGLANAVEAPAPAVSYIYALAVSPRGALLFRLVVAVASFGITVWTRLP